MREGDELDAGELPVLALLRVNRLHLSLAALELLGEVLVAVLAAGRCDA